MSKFLLSLMLLSCYLTGSAQVYGSVTGKVTSKETSEVIRGATITLKGHFASGMTNKEGLFTLTNVKPGPTEILISHVGYEPVEIVVVVKAIENVKADVSLETSATPADEVVLSASKRLEKITNAPASIQVIGQKDLNEFAGSNVTELVSKLQGLEYTRAGVDDITFNARGLHSAFNNKVFQLVDSRNTMASASAGLALFNNGSTNKDDIDRIEIALGPQSALYGPNAHNALFNYITKDPRKYQGTSISASAGSQNQFSTRFRHAKKINNRWAYKLTGEQATGKEYAWYDSVRAGSPTGLPFGPAVSIPLRVPDLSFRRIRGETHVYYSITPKADIIVSGGGSKFTRFQVTTGTHNLLRDVTYGFLQGRFVHPRFFANIYNTWGNLGSTMFLGSYTRDFWNRTHSTLTTGANRYLPPDSAEMFATRLGNTVKEKSQRTNAEVQYNYNFQRAGLLLVTGLTYQQDRPNGYGFTLIDSFQRIRITQYGAVLQLDKSLPWQLRLVASTRLDHHSDFKDFLAPRFALLKGIGRGTFRITWGRAYAMPSIQNLYAGINRSLFGNSGSGILYIPNGANINDVNARLNTTPLQPEQVSTWEVGYKGNVTNNLYLDVSYYNGLSKNFISPSRSVGGRVISVNKISVTHNPAFAGIVNPNGILSDASFSTFFNYGDVRAYGVDAAVTYKFNKSISLAFKYSWFGSDITDDNMKNDSNKDGYVSPEERSLNAPKNRAVAIVDFQDLFKKKFFLNLSARYVEQYEFYSGSQIGTVAGKGKWGIVEIPGKPPLLKNFDWGPLGGFTTIDMAAGYRFNATVAVNAGVTNLFNTRQIEMVAAPSIGRLITVELKVQVPD